MPEGTLGTLCPLRYNGRAAGTATFRIKIASRKLPGPSGSAVQGVGMRPLACWECGLESRREHGCLLCCVLSGRGLCDQLITRPEESYRLHCCVWSRSLNNLNNQEAMARIGAAAPQKKKVRNLVGVLGWAGKALPYFPLTILGNIVALSDFSLSDPFSGTN